MLKNALSLKPLKQNQWMPNNQSTSFFYHGTFIGLILFISLICACSKSSLGKQKIETDQSQKNETDLFSYALDEAKNSDAPIPIGFVLKQHETCENVDHFVYHGYLSIAQTRFFYLQEMERLGWEIVAFTTPHEVLFSCSKKSKSCAFVIRSDKQKTSDYTELSFFTKHQSIAMP